MIVEVFFYKFSFEKSLWNFWKLSKKIFKSFFRASIYFCFINVFKINVFLKQTFLFIYYVNTPTLSMLCAPGEFTLFSFNNRSCALTWIKLNWKFQSFNENWSFCTFGWLHNSSFRVQIPFHIMKNSTILPEVLKLKTPTLFLFNFTCFHWARCHVAIIYRATFQLCDTQVALK